jgi:hypothetical protein
MIRATLAPSPGEQDVNSGGHTVSASHEGLGFKRVDGCDLCRALKLTPWFWEDEICWIAECEICETPMVVWRYHGTAPPAEHVAHMRERLREVATNQLGEFWVDGHMRNIPDHYHAHARPKDGFFGRDRKR